MYLKTLSMLNFKNIAQEDVEFSQALNCIVGDNGTGKTNVLDAVYYLSMCKSSLPMTDTQAVRHGEQFFVLDGKYLTSTEREEQIVCSFIKGSSKIVKRNGKNYERLSEHVGFIPAVMVSPSDTMLISDAADERRRFMNGFLSQLDREYLSALIRYNAALSERNKYLKTGSDEQMLLAYDAQLAAHGQLIYERRRAAVEQLQPIVAEYYALLSHDSEKVEVSYRSEMTQMSAAEMLLRAREKDIVNQFTTSGVHRDDVVFGIGGLPLRRYGSQGQQKSFLVALKLAQYTISTRRKGERPILLLDDVFDKLDENRVEALLRLVSGDEFGQIIITDCNRLRMEELLRRSECEYKIFEMHGGHITP